MRMKRFLMLLAAAAVALVVAEWIQGLVLTAVYQPEGGSIEMVMWVRIYISALCVTGVYLLVDGLNRKGVRA